MSSLQTPEADVKRRTSLKHRLRGLSINRNSNKSAHFEEQEPNREIVDIGSPSMRSTKTRTDSSSSELRPLDLETDSVQVRGRSQGRHNTISSNTSSISQAQLATPLLSTPVITGSDHTVSSGSTNATFVPVMDPSVEEEQATTPVPSSPTAPGVAASGFLSSVFSVATNIGNVLGAGPTKSSPARDSIKNIPLEPTDSPVTALKKPTVASVGLGDVSLKDMGIVEKDVDETPEKLRPRHGATFESTASSHDTTDTARMRSASRTTTRNRRRRGSTALSVFGSETNGQKITGFAVASNKRNREFHATFRSVPEGDYLLDDYGCALQKEILVHGRMYVSESHICFNSNIFGWVTNLVIGFSDIISIEKKSTAGIFPNAIQISTQQARHVFASFISRDTTYDLIVNIWRLTHPVVRPTTNGVEIASEEDDESYNSDAIASSDEDESVSQSQSDGEVEENTILAVEQVNSERDSPKIMPMTATSPSNIDEPANSFPGPKEHGVTEAPSLTDGSAYAKHLLDECYDAPLGQVFELLYGNDTTFMQDFLVVNQKLLDVQIKPFVDKGGSSVRQSSYVKPLSGPIGPKQTRCLLEDVIDAKDFEQYIQVTQSTTSPDVPNGDAFVIKTRFNFMWGPRNTTRLVTNCAIEWSKTSWIKGPIEKGANAGQVQFMADLSDAIKSHLASGGSGRKKKHKEKKARADVSHTQGSTGQVASTSAPATTSGGAAGVLEYININVLIVALLVGMMLAMWKMHGTIRELKQHTTRDIGSMSLSNLRWQREESDLWAWLADRTTGGQDYARAPAAMADAKSLTALQLKEALEQQVAVLKHAEVLLDSATVP